MPEYLAPGVYIEETSFRSKSIEGVSTTTTGFIGPTRCGPFDVEPEILASLSEFERVYGDGQKLEFDGDELDNYIWHAARAFFEEGGKRLYLSRVFHPLQAPDGTHTLADRIAECCGRGSVPDGVPLADAVQVRARFPGKAGNKRVNFTLQLGKNILTDEVENQGGADVLVKKVKSLQHRDVVWMGDVARPVPSLVAAGQFYLAQFDEGTKLWSFEPVTGAAVALEEIQFPVGHGIRVVTLTISTEPTEGKGPPQAWADLPLDPAHMLGSVHDSFTDTFTETPVNPAQGRTPPVVLTVGENLNDGLNVLTALLAAKADWQTQLEHPDPTERERTHTLILAKGNDGLRPGPAEYEGTADETNRFNTGLKTFEAIEDISIVAGPGSTFGYESGFASEARVITNLLIAHAEGMHYRIAVLDSGDGQSISQVRAMRAGLDSSHAALHYPWVRVLDPRR